MRLLRHQRTHLKVNAVSAPHVAFYTVVLIIPSTQTTLSFVLHHLYSCWYFQPLPFQILAQNLDAFALYAQFMAYFEHIGSLWLNLERILSTLMPNQECIYQIPALPPPVELETLEILKALAVAHRYLAELKGLAASIPNQGILIDSLALQEAKASSEIENIVTTQDDLFRSDSMTDRSLAGPSKEVALYRDALKMGWDELNRTQGIIANRSLVKQFQLLKGINSGFRTTEGTVLQSRDDRVVYVPPQHPDEIQRHMTELERFINDDERHDLDPIIKMAIIHHQFESIHPFPDGNGRIGRILNVLYLTKSGLLDTPILYLSRYINLNKNDYYKLLQAVRDSNNAEENKTAWQAWVLYMLHAVADTSQTTLHMVRSIREQMSTMKVAIRDGDLKRIYSQDLINILFRHPYTRIEFLENELGVARNTTTKYLEQLVEAKLLTKLREGRNSYYINHRLVDLFVSLPGA